MRWNHGIYRGPERGDGAVQQKAYDRIDLVVKKGRRDEIKRFAAALGKSTNQFINDAIDRAMAEAADQ